MPETFFKVLHQLVSIRNFRIERHVNRESERIIIKTAFLTVEDSLHLAAGIFNLSGGC